MFEYFRDILESNRRVEELRQFPGKVIGTFCNFMPDEIAIAAGAIPVRLCSGKSEMADLSTGVFPRDCCSIARACMGSVAANDPLYDRVDLFVVPAACDAKKKLAQSLRTSKPTVTLSLPAEKDSPIGRRMWLGEIEQLAATVEDLTTTKITPQTLRAAIDLTNRRQRVFREFLDLRKNPSSAITGTDAFTITSASSFPYI